MTENLTHGSERVHRKRGPTATAPAPYFTNPTHGILERLLQTGQGGVLRHRQPKGTETERQSTYTAAPSSYSVASHGKLPGYGIMARNRAWTGGTPVDAYRARVTSKGQIPVPIQVRRALGLHAGSDVLFEVDRDGVRVHPVRPDPVFRQVMGKWR